MLQTVKPVVVRKPLFILSRRKPVSDRETNFFNCEDFIHEIYITKKDRIFMPEFSQINFMVKDNTKVVGYIISGRYFCFKNVY